VVEDHELWVDPDVAAVPGLPLDRGGDLAADEIEEIAPFSVILPPLAVDVSASDEIAARLFISSRTAETVIDPASPLPVDLAVICGPRSGSTISEAAAILTSPPLLGPAVELAICAPPWTVRLLAVRVTEPPDPDCDPMAEAAIWVLASPAPLRISAPGVATFTEPPVRFRLWCSKSRRLWQW
jgi:hypothetical protein